MATYNKMKAYYDEHVAEEDKRLWKNVFEMPVNYRYLDRYLRTGNKVRVMRAGDVIPEIAECVDMGRKNRGKPFRMPDQYPVCPAEVIREGAYVVCPEVNDRTDYQLVGENPENKLDESQR